MLAERTEEIRTMIVNEGNVKPFKTPQQKRQRWIAIVVVLAILGVTAIAYFLLIPQEDVFELNNYQSAIVKLGNLTQTTQASGAVVLPVQLLMSSPEAGYAAGIFAAEGDTVVNGQILARIDVPDLQDELVDLEKELESARRAYGKLIQQNLVINKRKERDILGMKKDVAEAEEERDRLRELVKINATRRSDLDQAEKALEAARDGKTEQELQLQEDTDLQALDVEIQRAAITRTETQVQRINERIDAATIRSTMDGEILTIDETLAVAGSTINKNQQIITIVDPSSAIVELDVAEQYAATLAPGQPVELTVNNIKSIGTVTNVGKVAQISSDGLGATITVKAKPGPDSGRLLQGSTAVGVFELGIKEGTLLLPRGPYLTTGSQRYLYVVDGNTARRADVTFGEVKGSNIEILKGVSAGDEVVTSGYQNFIQYNSVRLR
ncbi:MAG: hypothetical protein CMN78_04315 [Spirochaetales bacterium]|nr:hypothetical protein [Spirochaetales bacterium]